MAALTSTSREGIGQCIQWEEIVVVLHHTLQTEQIWLHWPYSILHIMFSWKQVTGPTIAQYSFRFAPPLTCFISRLLGSAFTLSIFRTIIEQTIQNRLIYFATSVYMEFNRLFRKCLKNYIRFIISICLACTSMSLKVRVLVLDVFIEVI